MKNRGDARAPALYNREQFPQSDIIASGNSKLSTDKVKERSDYIDIVYMDAKTNESVKHFGNLGVDTRENRRVYGIEDVIKVFLF